MPRPTAQEATPAAFADVLPPAQPDGQIGEKEVPLLFQRRNFTFALVQSTVNCVVSKRADTCADSATLALVEMVETSAGPVYASAAGAGLTVSVPALPPAPLVVLPLKLGPVVPGEYVALML